METKSAKFRLRLPGKLQLAVTETATVREGLKPLYKAAKQRQLFLMVGQESPDYLAPHPAQSFISSAMNSFRFKPPI